MRLALKREHRVAFICALALGFVLGVVFGYHQIAPKEPSLFWTVSCGYGDCVSHWAHIAPWAALGAFIGGALVAIQLLLRP